MSDAHLQRQIEQIADEANGRRVSVIVQMQTQDDLGSHLRETAEAIESRRAVTSARVLLPPPRGELGTVARGGAASAARRSGRAPAVRATESLLRDDPLRGQARERRGAAHRAGTQALQPLLRSRWVAERVAAARQTKRKSAPAADAVPVHFTLSGSAVLDVSIDDLVGLAGEVERIADIYPNRTVKVPPVAKSSTLPRVVEDNKSNSWGLVKTGALAAWGAFEARGAGAVIAILDTGVDAAHPDLKGKVAGFAEFDADGRLVTDRLADAYDSDEHGTHCAGTVVGGRESGRWIGMAPEAKVMAGLVLKGGYGTDAQILGGMEWAIRSGAHVISMSLGGLRLAADVLDTYTRTIIAANDAGIPVVVAAGNEGSQTTGSPGNDYFAFTVGATDPEDWAAGFSGGRTQVFESSRYIDPRYLPLVYSKPEVSAPGVAIYSSTPGGKWAAWNGTSMATPHVAGAMALLLGKGSKIPGIRGGKRVELLQRLLVSTVKELGEAGQNHRFGHGRIDVLRALGYAEEGDYYVPPGAGAGAARSSGRRGRGRAAPRRGRR